MQMYFQQRNAAFNGVVGSLCRKTGLGGLHVIDVCSLGVCVQNSTWWEDDKDKEESNAWRS